MSDFILNKQKEQKTNVRTSLPSVSKKQTTLMKMALLFLVFAVFITLSVLNNQLFLTELIVSASIVGLVCFIHLRSQVER